MAHKGKVVEIFKSVQGEGKYVGLPQVFLRLSFCNLQCTYCDTDFQSGNWMSAQEALDAIAALLRTHAEVASVAVTGGEPLLQDGFLQEILPSLKEQGLNVLLETNGTIAEAFRKIETCIDVVSMDIKLASASLTKDLSREHDAFLVASQAKDRYVKVVLSAQTTDEDFARAVGLLAGHDPSTCFVLQPVTPLGLATPPTSQQLERWTGAARVLLRDVRVIPQMHKQWGIP